MAPSSEIYTSSPPPPTPTPPGSSYPQVSRPTGWLLRTVEQRRSAPCASVGGLAPQWAQGGAVLEGVEPGGPTGVGVVLGKVEVVAIRHPHLRAREVRAGQVCAPQVRAEQTSILQIGAVEIGTVEIGVGQVRPRQWCIEQHRTPKDGVPTPILRCTIGAKQAEDQACTTHRRCDRRQPHQHPRPAVLHRSLLGDKPSKKRSQSPPTPTPPGSSYRQVPCPTDWLVLSAGWAGRAGCSSGPRLEN